MNISVNITTLDTAVKRQLAVIAKRAVTKDGTSMFSNITPSSAEEEAIHDFYTDAVMLLNTTSQYFVTATTTPAVTTPGASAAGTITLTFPPNHNDAMNTTITVAFTTFLVTYAVYAWLAIVSPALVERYQLAMREKLDALIQLIFHKTPPHFEYTYDLPPTLSLPGDTLTLQDGEQRLIAYSLGSDNVDDLVIQSSMPSVVRVSKNDRNRVFSILADSDVASLTATVTFLRENTDEVLAQMNVTALPQPESGSVTSNPVLIGYNVGSDTVAIAQGQHLYIPYSGTITNVAASNTNITAVLEPGASTPRISVLASEVGSATLTIYADNWSYNLYVSVEEVQGTSPVISVVSPVVLSIGGTQTINYTLGSDAIDDLVIQAESSTIVRVSKSTLNHTFTVTGLTGGPTNISITSARHPESNVSFLTVVQAAATDTPPSIISYDDGDTINTIAGASAIRISFYPGDNGTFTISASPQASVALSRNDEYQYVDVSPLAAGNVNITFSNASYSWSRTIHLAIAARPAVITPPTVFWPEGLSLKEGPYSAYVDYELGNDNVDSIYMSSSDTSVLVIEKNATAHSFHLAAQGHGTAIVHIYDTTPSHNIDEYKTVNVEWVAPRFLSGLQDGDELTLPEVFEAGAGWGDEDFAHNPPTIGTDGLQIQFVEASSGTTTVTAYPANRVHIGITSTSSNGIIVKTVTIHALQEGLTYLNFVNPNGWSARLSMNVGSASGQEPVVLPPTITPPSSSTFEQGTTIYIHYTPASDGTDDLSMSTDVTDVATITKDTTNHRFQVYLQRPGSYGLVVTSSAFPEINTTYNITVMNSGTLPLPEATSPHDQTMYIRGTVSGITNPIITTTAGSGTFYVEVMTGQGLATYNESTEAVNYVSYTQSQMNDVIQAVINSIYNKFGETFTGQESTSSYPVTPEAYINLDNTPPSVSIPQYSGQRDCFVFLDGVATGQDGAEFTNVCCYIDSSGVGYLVVIDNSGTYYPVLYDEANEELTQSVGYAGYSLDGPNIILSYLRGGAEDLGYTITVNSSTMQTLLKAYNSIANVEADLGSAPARYIIPRRKYN